MIKKQPKGSLADKIAGVLSAVPTQFDPDDDHLDDTKAKLVDLEDSNEESEVDEVLLSKFRKQNVDLLADVDPRYAGKGGSRKSLKSESSDDFSQAETSSDDNESELGNNDELEGDSDGSEGDSYESENLSDLDESNFQHITETNISEQVKKGQCVRNQMNIWESLLEMRIQMQKCLMAANKLPQKGHFKVIERNNESVEFKNKAREAKDSLGIVLDKMLNLQSLLIKKYPETRKLGNNDKDQSVKEEENDEEIPSDTDEEIQDNEESEDENHQPKHKKRKLNDYEKIISDMHCKYINYRNETIEKWNTKTRLSVTKNSGQTHSVVGQIEHILNDKNKLRKRTQLKRSDYRILGHDDNKDAVFESNEENGDIKQIEEYNSEIFDDSDFYHQLLRELIEVKSADITDPVQLGRQWIQLQNLRSKMKRKVDTRATKGRKIRYAVHTKLVNFMAPVEKQFWTEEAKNELYSSLFGKLQ